jgi:hypothetical protein
MNTQLQALQAFGEAMSKNPDLVDEFKKDPLKVSQQFELQPINDKWVYRLVVASLGLTILIIILGVIVLMFNSSIRNDATVPTIFTALGSAAIGALAGLLAPSPKNS